MVNQGWGRKGIPGFFDIYRDDVTEKVPERDLLLAKTESINIGGSASVRIHFSRRQKKTKQTTNCTTLAVVRREE